jgi:putative phage-type endonuclease
MYKILSIEQGSEEWLALRKTKITGTDAAVILHLNPWKNLKALYEEKMGYSKKKFKNDAMIKGSEMEPFIRDQYNEENGTDFKPAVLLHENDWAMASLDGLNSNNQILEIKYGEKAYDLAVKGVIPDYYKAQIQHCLWVSLASECVYHCCNPKNKKEKITIIVKPDISFIENMIIQEHKFYSDMMNYNAPIVNCGEFEIKDSKEWRMYTAVLLEAREMIDKYKIIEEQTKEELIKLSDGKCCMGHGIKLSKLIKKGNIDYSCIPELKNVDLNVYRTKSTEIWRITSERKEKNNL